MSEEFLEESSKLDLYYAERKLASPIIHLIHDWQQAKEKGQEKPESELKQEILNLLDNGGDVNEPELPLSDYNYGYTPILIASEAGAVEVVQALIERGANVDAILTQLNQLIQVIQTRIRKMQRQLLTNRKIHFPK